MNKLIKRDKMKSSAKKRTFCINLENCTYCRACELACSFHLIGSFNPEKSAIKVYRYNGNIEFCINSSCDFCHKESIPLCMKYCAPKAIAINIQSID